MLHRLYHILYLYTTEHSQEKKIGTVTAGKTGAVRGWRDAGDCSSDDVTMVQATTTAAASATATGVQETPAGRDGDRWTPRRPKRRRGASS